MQTRKKQTQKGKASPPKTPLTQQELKISLLRKEQRVILQLFDTHLKDFETLQGRYTTLKKEYNRICNVLLDSIKNTSELLRLVRALEKSEAWKPEVRELIEPIKIPISLN